MLKISEATIGLRWSQPSALRAEYELRLGDVLVGILRLRELGTLGTAESGDGSWTFKRVGFWQNRATIRVLGSDMDLAEFRNNTWPMGGALKFQAGRTFRATTNLWMTQFAFSDEADVPLVRFHYGGAFRRWADVEITEVAKPLPELPLLVLFGWYLLVMLDRDAAAILLVTG